MQPSVTWFGTLFPQVLNQSERFSLNSTNARQAFLCFHFCFNPSNVWQKKKKGRISMPLLRQNIWQTMQTSWTRAITYRWGNHFLVSLLNHVHDLNPLLISVLLSVNLKGATKPTSGLLIWRHMKSFIPASKIIPVLLRAVQLLLQHDNI